MTLKSDASDLSGIEYKLVSRKRAASATRFRRYKSPVLVPKGTTIIWRAVDLNGNSEATHSLRG